MVGDETNHQPRRGPANGHNGRLAGDPATTVYGRRAVLQLATAGLAGSALWCVGCRPRCPPKVGASQQLPPPKLDAHAHIYSPDLVRLVNRRLGRQEFQPLDAAALVARLDRQGIEQAVVLSGAYLAAADVFPKRLDEADEVQAVQRENDRAAAQVAPFADRLRLFCSVNPKRSWAADEIARCQQTHRARGVKLHFWNSLVDPLDDAHRACLRAVVSRAAALDLPLLVHAYNGQLRDFGADHIVRVVEDTLEAVPISRVCLAHVGGAGGFDPSVQRVFARLVSHVVARPNLARRCWIDLAAVAFSHPTRIYPASSPGQLRLLAELLRDWGTERLLWGSDSIPDYLEQLRAVWPLDRNAWQTMASNSGRAFLEGSAAKAEIGARRSECCPAGSGLLQVLSAPETENRGG